MSNNADVRAYQCIGVTLWTRRKKIQFDLKLEITASNALLDRFIFENGLKWNFWCLRPVNQF